MNAVRSYRIRWAWKNGGRIFTATTLWLFPGDRAGALRNFINRRPEAVSARVVEECL